MDAKSNAKKIFVSNEVFLQPIIDLSQEQMIDVYTDNDNPDNYWVDISKIPVKRIPTTFGVIDGYYRSYDGINYQKSE